MSEDTDADKERMVTALTNQMFKRVIRSHPTATLLALARHSRQVVERPLVAMRFPHAREILNCYLGELMRRARGGALLDG